MNKSIQILMISFLLAACAKTNSASNGQTTQGKVCSGNIVRQWADVSTKYNYDFKSDCTGYITQCQASFDYEVLNSGQMYITVNSSNGNLNCPVVNTEKQYCDYHIKATAGIVQSMVINCGNGEMILAP